MLLLLALIGVGLAALGGAGNLLAGGRESAAPEGIEEAGQPAASPEEPTGYVLALPEGDEGYGEVLFLQLVREGAERPEGGQSMTGYLSNTTASVYEPRLPVAYVTTNNVEGTIDGSSLQFTEETPSGGASASATFTSYYGTIEGSSMELTRDLPGARTTWVGEEGTLEDYHEEVEGLVGEAQEEAENLPSQ